MRNEVKQVVVREAQVVELTPENWIDLWRDAGGPQSRIVDYGRMREFDYSSTLVLEASELGLAAAGWNG